MHKSYAKLYVFALIAWTVEKSECKQGENPNESKDNKYKQTACLSFGHSCWGAHGKRDADATKSPLFLYRLAQMQQKLAAIAVTDSDQSAYQNLQKSLRGEGLPPPLPQDYYNIWKAYAERNAINSNNDDVPKVWNIRSSEYAPSGDYYNDQPFNPRTVYKVMNL